MASQNNAPFFIDQEILILSRNGIWLADGTEISHEPTRRLFARSLQRDGHGYFLKIGRETKRVQVEDTAYFIQRIEGDPLQEYKVFISDETYEGLNPQTLHYRPGRLVCKVKGGQEEAKFLHAAYFDLLRHLEEDEKSYFLKFRSGTEQLRIQLASK